MIDELENSISGDFIIWIRTFFNKAYVILLFGDVFNIKKGE